MAEKWLEGRREWGAGRWTLNTSQGIEEGFSEEVSLGHKSGGHEEQTMPRSRIRTFQEKRTAA